MSTEKVTRRTVLKTLGAGAGALTFLPLLSEDGLAAFAEVQKARVAAPALKVLTPAQYATVEQLVEAIIPTDERSPGAKQARVADYLDLLLSEAEPGLRDQWLAGLKALDAESTSRYGAPFVKLTPDKVEALLTEISKYETATKPSPGPADPGLDLPRNEEPKPRPPQVETLLGDIRVPRGTPRPQLEEFFAQTKQATIHGYYTSEVGIQQELKYKGNKHLVEFVGCLTVDGKDCPYCGQKAQA
jgi:hypothetical protein